MKTKPFRHQQEVFDKFREREFFGIFAEQGLGKSKMIIDQVCQLYLDDVLDAVLIVAPNGLHNNWYHNEIPTHLWDQVEPDLRAVTWQPNHTKKWTYGWEAFTETFSDNNRLKIFCINVEALRTEKGKKYAQEFIRRTNNVMFVLDESTCIKNPKAMQTKAVIKLADSCEYRRILTGTPITQGPLDIFAQSRMLSPQALPFTSYTAFKHKFAIEEIQYAQGRSFRKITGYRNLDELTKHMDQYSVRILKRDCLDLPEKLYQKISIEMNKEQQDLYNQIKNECLALIDDNLITATNVLKKILKLQEVCCGFVKDDEGDVLQVKDSKEAMLMQTLESVQGKVVIFCHFKHVVTQLTKVLEERYGKGSVIQYTGDTKNRTEAISLFQEDPSVRFFLCTSAASKGITLTAASYMVYYSNDYNLENRLQSEDRIHRIGQTEPCQYIDLVMRDSIDESVLHALTNKQNISKLVLDDLKKIL